MKTAVVYWSGTGNTEAMAGSVAEGAKSAGAEVSVFTAADFSADMVDQFDSSLSVVPQWAVNSLRTASSSLCSTLVKQSCQARR